MADRRMQQWHLGKEIPIALVVGIVIQTAALIWSIAALYNKVDNLVATTNELRAERYSKEDARRDALSQQQMQDFQRHRDAEQDRRINQLEVTTSQLMRGVK